MGDAPGARDSASRAAALDDNDPRSHALLGDALAALGERLAAQDAYRRSLRLRPDPRARAQDRRAGRRPGRRARPPRRARSSACATTAEINEPLGAAVLEVLAGRLRQLRRPPPLPARRSDHGRAGAGQRASRNRARRSGRPGSTTGPSTSPCAGWSASPWPSWPSSRHELAHSFIRARTGGNCPTWLQEGIAQWLEGGDPRREDAVVAAAARQGRLLPLMTLEGPFQSLPPEQVEPRLRGEPLRGRAHRAHARRIGDRAAAGRARRPSARGGGAARRAGPQLSGVPEELGGRPQSLSAAPLTSGRRDTTRASAAAPSRSRPWADSRAADGRRRCRPGCGGCRPARGGRCSARAGTPISRAERVQELPQRHAVAGGHVDVLADEAARLERAQVPLDDVLHVGEVAALQAVAVDDGPASRRGARSRRG